MSSLILSNVLYGLNFPINVLPINDITQALFLFLHFLSLVLHLLGFAYKEEDYFGCHLYELVHDHLMIGLSYPLS